MNRAVAKALESAAFYTAVEQAMSKYVLELQFFDAVAKRMANALALTVRVAKFIKHKVKKSCLEKAKMEERFVNLSVTVNEKNIKEKDVIPIRKMDSV